jgi:hypothetical protein
MLDQTPAKSPDLHGDSNPSYSPYRVSLHMLPSRSILGCGARGRRNVLCISGSRYIERDTCAFQRISAPIIMMQS